MKDKNHIVENNPANTKTNIFANLSTTHAEITSLAGYSVIKKLLPKYSPSLPGVKDPVATPTKKEENNFLFDNSPIISPKTAFHLLSCK
ncbi:MAG: hypothetical protein WC879_02655 [Melioribacteraceae bacterium]